MKTLLQLSVTFFTYLVLAVPALLQGQNALNFDGSNDFVQTTYAGVTGSADRTFEAWINISSSASGNNCILDYGLNAVGSRNTFMVSGTKQLSYIAGGTNTNFGTTANAVPTDVWTHVAMVMENGQGTMYVNGVAMGTGSLTGVSTPAGNANMTIGQRVSGGNLAFLGSIDEVRVWDVARTAAEIQATMNTEFCAAPASLKAYYKFNQATAGGTNTGMTTLTDDSGNANDGTVTNFALAGASSNWVSGASLTSTVSNAGTLTVSNCVPFTSLGNQVITNTGMYQDTVVMASGCDSIYTLDFTALSASASSFTATACGSYTAPSGAVFTTTGMYMDTIPNALGCDSVMTINLSVSSNAQATITASACNAYTSPSGKIFTTTGVYMDTIPSLVVCDSIMTINLTVNSATQSAISETACISYTSPAGNVYTSTGVYNDTIPNSVGCDSIIVINLTIQNSTLIGQSFIACDSYTSPSGQIWTSTGVYQDTVFGGASCASIYTINLVINTSKNTSITETSCGAFTSGLGNVYTTSGSYTEVGQTSNGCDSTITIDLTVIDTDNSVSQNGATLSANETSATYQWYNCADQSVISGATSQSFSATANGSYSVEIVNGTCTVNSECVEVNNVGINGVQNNTVAYYPNPTSGMFTIELDARYEDVTLRVLSLDGRIVQTKEFKNTNQLQFEIEQAAGLYTVQVLTNGVLSNIKVLKLD